MDTDLTTFIPRAAQGVTITVVWESSFDECNLHIHHAHGFTSISVSERIARKLSDALRQPRTNPVPWVRGLESAGEILPDVSDT